MAVIKEEYFSIARKIVSNMTSESWRKIPHATMVYEADATEFMKYCKQLNEGNTDKSKKITINTVMIKVICEGLKAAPRMNTTLEFDKDLVRGTLFYHDNIDVSMPIILKTDEMMTVNMHNMEDLTLSEMTAKINDTIRRANNSNMNEVMYQVSLNDTIDKLKDGKVTKTIARLYGSKMPGNHHVSGLSGEEKDEYYSISKKDRLTRHDIEQGTTTISNLGSIYREQKGACMLLEIIPPQTTAFAINAAQDRPVVVTNDKGKKEIDIRTIIPITIAIDHRALDFNHVVPFFRKLDEIFADPAIILDWK